MAKPRCDQHKRSLPYCDACKEAVRVSREAELQAEQGAIDEDAEAEADNQKHNVLEEALREEESNALKAGVGFPSAQEEVPETGEPVEGDEPITDPWADGKTPEEGQDVGDWVPPAERVTPRADIDETEEAMIEAEEPPMNSEVRAELAVIIAALESGEPVTLLVGEDAEESLRNEGRKEMVKKVREYFADGIDTVAFQLLEYLEKACR